MMEPSVSDGDTRRYTGLKGLTGLIASLIVVAVVAAFGGQFTPDSWYQEIGKPSWTPPGWIFGPVWTFLYASMGVAAWLVWLERDKRISTPALGAYILQLLLNGVWSWVFFGLHLIGLALVDLILMWIFIVVTTILFWKVRTAAGILLLPYLAWVTFAGILNYTIWTMNP